LRAPMIEAQLFRSMDLERSEADVLAEVERVRSQAGAQRSDGLVLEGQRLYVSGKEEEALDMFIQALAFADTKTSGEDIATVGAINSNIGACLHRLGHETAARGFYERAVTCFKAEQSSVIDVAILGDVNVQRLKFLEERLRQLQQGRPPDPGKYLTKYGTTQAYERREASVEVHGASADAVSDSTSLKYRGSSMVRPPLRSRPPRMLAFKRLLLCLVLLASLVVALAAPAVEMASAALGTYAPPAPETCSWSWRRGCVASSPHGHCDFRLVLGENPCRLRP